MKKKTKQISFDFSDIRIVKNLNGEKFHIQRSNGLAVENTPIYFDSEAEAIMFAKENGIKINSEGADE